MTHFTIPLRTLNTVLVLFVLFSLPVQAKIETYQFDTVQQEDLYKEMIAELRCLVCQNQNLADSNAELAQDLRAKTYEMISDGKDRNEIVDFMVQRYGDFVLYKPPFKPETLVLWIGPLMIFLIAVFIAIRNVKRRPANDTEPAQMTDQGDDTLTAARQHLRDD